MPEAPLLRMTGIEKSYPGVRALAAVDFDLRRAEVHALLGENGAGKSTLMKVLAGAHAPDKGRVEIDGRPVQFRHPADAQRAGVAVIHQEFVLIPALTARENIFLGRGRVRAGFVRHSIERREAARLFERLGVDIDPETPCSRLSVGQQQLVEIARALALDARILVMDEPSAALSGSEVERLERIVDELRGRGLGIVYITHRLAEVERLADRVSILRDGQRVASGEAQNASRGEWIELMVGRPLAQEFPPRVSHAGETRLVVRGLSRPPAVNDVSFEVRAGEVLGLTGLVGAGRTELARLLFGADRRSAGTVEIDGRSLNPRDPRTAIGAGVCLLPEDRKRHGLLLGRSLRENFALGNAAELSSRGWIRASRERQRFQRRAEALKLRVTSSEQLAGSLSGGNQQKLLLARWLEKDARLMVLDEPTRGIDVGARYEIYALIRTLAAEGKSLLVISSEMPEVLGVCDRVLVMHAGRLTGDCINDDRLTQERLMKLALGEERKEVG